MHYAYITKVLFKAIAACLRAIALLAALVTLPFNLAAFVTLPGYT
jgi:hypothetical protein